MRVAYGIVPVHPVDRYLLGMQLANTYILDMALSFGLCSAIYNLSSVANLVEWIIRENYEVGFHLHCLDDFHKLGPPSSLLCQYNLDRCI